MKYSPYSFSKISSFQHCPMKFKLNYIDKIRIPTENIALEKGKFLHHIIENVIMDFRPPEFKFELATEEQQRDFVIKLKDFMRSDCYKEYYALEHKETERGFSIDFDGVNIKAGDYNNHSLIRGFIDFISKNGNKLLIVDWKSGKYKEDINQLQVAIYALWGFLTFDVDIIECEFCFIEHSKKVTVKFERNDINKLIKDIFSEIMYIEKAQSFKKKPSALCDWCDYKKQGYCDGEFDFSPSALGIKI